MKKDKNKIREPYNPEHTPNPPQIIDPSKKKERNEDDPAIEEAREDQPKSMRQDKRQNEIAQTKKESGKLLGDETEIDDETTI